MARTLNFGELIFAWRIENDLSQKEAAEKFNAANFALTRQALQAWECGRNAIRDPSDRIRAAEIMGYASGSAEERAVLMAPRGPAPSPSNGRRTRRLPSAPKKRAPKKRSSKRAA